ncbi:FUSC family protein [Bacillus sp. B-jedd]|uniref:FUSC family protein n=1 Tax=Bacillus sp. B-jedd TaxID=1476857 RepID=UPI0005157071|nr:FUSC family protein [Bacillus sp. B-jedd]CEG29431.1 hypothetical protein BN1002_04369 [Bacillus sp. B-jedd]
MKKKIISNTILFISILAFIKIFAVLFGTANTLVGVTVVVAILVLMQENLTKKPMTNLAKLLFINLTLGILAYISSHNIWLGLIINFAALSGIGYFLSVKLNKNIIVPFGLQYLFMLYTPVDNGDFTKRLLGLAFGAVMIMLVQFIIHRKSVNKQAEESGLIEEKQDQYRCVKIFKKEYKVHVVRGSYAIRIGLLTAITAFLVAFFKIEQGRWIVYTIFSLTELYSEECKTRSAQRLQGTIIGVAIILVLFTFIKDSTVRGLIALLGGYLDSYTRNYKEKMICVTMSVVAAASLTNSALSMVTERIGYILIGIVLALLVDKFILRKQLTEFT